MKIGSDKPTLPKDLNEKSQFHRIFIKCDWAAAWFYFGFNNFPLIRFSLQAVAVVVLVLTVLEVYFDFQQRKADRAVRVATLFSQIAHLHALPDGKGLKGLKPSVEALSSEGVPMSNINLSGADLKDAQLSGAKLDGADLTGADLHRADLRYADLSHADLTAAKLFEATITKANLQGANINETRLFHVKGLEKGQLEVACTTNNRKPHLGIGPPFQWKRNDCEYE